MNAKLEEICIALDELSNEVLEATAENRTLLEIYGWQSPAITRNDLASIPTILSFRIREAAIDIVDEKLFTELELIPNKLSLLHPTTVPQMFTSNSTTAVPSYLLTLEWLNRFLEPLLSWQTVNDPKLMPSKLAARVRSIQAGIDDLVPDKSKLEAQIKLIEEATATAESLPTDLEALKKASLQVNSISSQASELLGKIDINYQDSSISFSLMKQWETEANKVILLCQEAYRTATSTGLAGAFDDRARRLTMSTWGWVVGLILALSVGIVIGALRYDAMAVLIRQQNPSWGAVWMQLLLSVIGIAGPVWFAWLATKQIAQRFKLAEDYSYKASVAKAYEGYRREAAKIDPELERRLFASALTRLEEAPLRLMETEHHGSPFHELLNSPAFLKAMEIVPGLAEKVGSLYKDVKIKVSNSSSDKTKEEQQEI